MSIPPLRIYSKLFSVELTTVGANATTSVYVNTTLDPNATNSVNPTAPVEDCGYQLTAYAIFDDLRSESSSMKSILRGNRADNGEGGGLYIRDETLSPVIIGLEFIENRGKYGGGLALSSSNGSAAAALLSSSWRKLIVDVSGNPMDCLVRSASTMA